MVVSNPIVRGFWPDPSVCRANGKFYLACSSFQYFPGVPIFESDDLVNWKLIGHCLTRKTQVNLHKVNSSGGVFAPTLRFHDGRFYMVTNNNTFQKNFYVYTDDIYGEVLIHLCFLRMARYTLHPMAMDRMARDVLCSVRSMLRPEKN